jgi:hypothetical protein
MPEFSLDRRQFTLGVAAAATAALIHPSEALAQTASGTVAELDKKTRDAMAKLSPAARAEVEAKVTNIFRKYGERLNEEQKADIRRIVAESQEGFEKMRAFALENGDQPADAFRAYHSENQTNSSTQSSSIKSSSIKPREQKK